MLLCVPSLPICLSLLAPTVRGTCVLYLPLSRSCSHPSNPPGTGVTGFVGCCLQGKGLHLTAKPLLPQAGEEGADWGAQGQILHPCKPGWCQSYPSFCSEETLKDGDKNTQSTCCARCHRWGGGARALAQGVGSCLSPKLGLVISREKGRRRWSLPKSCRSCLTSAARSGSVFDIAAG